MNIETIKAKPIENGVIYLNEAEFKGYVDLLSEANRSIYTSEEIERRRKNMLSGRMPATWRNYQVRVKDRENQS